MLLSLKVSSKGSDETSIKKGFVQRIKLINKTHGFCPWSFNHTQGIFSSMNFCVRFSIWIIGIKGTTCKFHSNRKIRLRNSFSYPSPCSRLVLFFPNPIGNMGIMRPKKPLWLQDDPRDISTCFSAIIRSR